MVGSNGSPSPSPPQPQQRQSPDSAPSKLYGVTKPLSLAGPSDTDRLRTKELEKVCALFDRFRY